jgi:hypothetical protein
MVIDGRYLVHNEHVDGIKDREIVIKDGIVYASETKFSQKSFFMNNKIVRRI